MKNASAQKSTLRQYSWLAAIAAVYVLGNLISPPEGLSDAGWRAILFMICSTIAWVTEVIPMALTSTILLFLPEMLGIEKTAVVMQNFATPTLFFIMSALIIARAFQDSGFGKRVALFVTPLFGNSSKMVLLSLIVATSLLSTVLVNIPTAVIMGSVGYSLLKENNCEPGKSNFGKAIMIGIPIAASLGGIATPAGSGVNILAINLYKNISGYEIGFLQWCSIGIPLAIILTAIAWYVICLVYKPEIETIGGMDSIKQQRKELGPLSTNEKKFLVIFSITLILWFTQSWTGLNTAFVSMVTSCSFFIRGIDLCTWKKANETISWSSLLLVGSCNAIAMTLSSTKAAQWLSDTLLGGFANSGIFMLITVVSLFGIFIHLLVPISGAVVAMSVPIIAALGVTAGIDPTVLVLIIAYSASCVFMIPLDPTNLTTYSYGYWELKDMSKPGFIISFLWVPVLIVLMYVGHLLALF